MGGAVDLPARVILDGAGQAWSKSEAFCLNRKLMIDFHFPFRIIAYLDIPYRIKISERRWRGVDLCWFVWM
jgi:hypothetical protein